MDVHITLQSDISMPLAISSLQKQIKRYLEACAGVSVKEVRVFVEGATAPGAAAAQSPFAIPASMLGYEALTGEKAESALLEVDEVPAQAAAVEAVEEQAAEETQTAEAAEVVEAVEVAEVAQAAQEETACEACAEACEETAQEQPAEVE